MKTDYLRNRKIGSTLDLADDSSDTSNHHFKSWKERQQFQRYLFEYFEELNSGQCGWGVSFNNWLGAIKGWKHLGMEKYQKVHRDIE